MPEARLPDEFDGCTTHPLGEIDLSGALADLILECLPQLAMESWDEYRNAQECICTHSVRDLVEDGRHIAHVVDVECWVEHLALTAVLFA